MIELDDVTQRLIPLLGATIDLGNKNPKLHPIIKAVHDMQMAAKWLELAKRDREEMTEGPTLKQQGETEWVKPNLKPPTLLGSMSYFNYIEMGLRDLNKELMFYKEVGVPGAALKYKLDRTYDRLVESQFNIELAKFYYEQLNGNTGEGSN